MLLWESRALSHATAAFLVTRARARSWEVSLISGHSRGLTCSQVVDNKFIHKESCYIICFIHLCFRIKAVFHVGHLMYDIYIRSLIL